MINRGLFIVFAVVIFGFTSLTFSRHNPMFFAMSQEIEEVEKQEVLFTFATKDTAVIHQLELLSDVKGNPLLFYSAIETPVCADGECKLAKIKVYWNLLGNYVGFGIYDKTPLTKNEHDPFIRADYLKLHQLLGDKHSILKRRKMEDLIDSVPVVGDALKTYKGIDAISGATKKEIKESVVKGGLYSCYTLWHLVNGEVIEDMQSYLKAIYSDRINSYFLQSPYADYQEYSLKELAPEDFRKNFEEIAMIFKTTSPIIRAYILKKIPNSLFVEKSITEQFYTLFSLVDTNTRTQLIQKMTESHVQSAELLGGQLNLMTKNQLQLYLDFLESATNEITSETKKNLKKYARSKEVPFNYVVKDFLKEI